MCIRDRYYVIGNKEVVSMEIFHFQFIKHKTRFTRWAIFFLYIVISVSYTHLHGSHVWFSIPMFSACEVRVVADVLALIRQPKHQTTRRKDNPSNPLSLNVTLTLGVYTYYINKQISVQ